jgi:hypothetical protein
VLGIHQATRSLDQLDGKKAELLRLLLVATPQDGSGVDSLDFRAQHFDQIVDIEWLESVGYIRTDQDRYFVSLTGLVQLDDPRALRIMTGAEQLYARLKQHYRSSPREPLAIDALAKEVGLGSIAAREALAYMVEGGWWARRPNNLAGPDAYIQPAEAILRFSAFSDIVAQLRVWQADRMADRQHALADAVEEYAKHNRDRKDHAPTVLRQRPDWFGRLPEVPLTLLAEVYGALAINLRALPAMGVRAIIDLVCVQLIGDVGSFERKLTALHDEGHITSTEQTILAAAIDAGNAAAHRGHIPTRDDLTTLIDIAERVLHGYYILPGAARKLEANTPARPKKKARRV